LEQTEDECVDGGEVGVLGWKWIGDADADERERGVMDEEGQGLI